MTQIINVTRLRVTSDCNNHVNIYVIERNNNDQI
jgi:hypothetical protein